MAKTGSLKDFFDSKYSAVEVVGELDGNKVFTMEDYVELNTLEHQANLNGIKLGNEVRVPDVDERGYLKRTPRTRLVMNEEIGFINRIRIDKEQKQLHIVIDYRAITEQNTGSIYSNSVSAYVVGKVDGKGDKYAVLSIINVPENEFINEFTDALTVSDAKLMYEVITHYRNTGTKTGISLKDVL